VLDDFLTWPEIQRRTRIGPPFLRRWVYTLVLFAAVLMTFVGATSVAEAMTQSTGTATDTGLMAAGLMLFVVAGALLLRFAHPVAFAIVASQEFFAWRTLFGWHAIRWDEIDSVLIKPHGHVRSREVFMKAGDARVVFGWSEAEADWTAPLTLLPAAAAKSLLRTMVQRAGMEQRNAGLWARPNLPTPDSAGVLPW
jgi:hypothetical protein